MNKEVTAVDVPNTEYDPQSSCLSRRAAGRPRSTPLRASHNGQMNALNAPVLLHLYKVHELSGPCGQRGGVPGVPSSSSHEEPMSQVDCAMSPMVLNGLEGCVVDSYIAPQYYVDNSLGKTREGSQ